MNINDFVSNQTAASYLGNNASSQSAARVSTATAAGLQKAEKRIQTQVDTTSSQLSSFGKLKSAVSDAQIAARGLGGLTGTTTSAAEKTAANTFVSAFNSAINASKTTAAVPGETYAATSSAGRVNRDLTRAINTNTATMDALKKIGFSMNASGSLVLDAKKFDAAQKADPAAVRATLTKIGQQVDKTATQELSTSGNVGASLSSLNQRAAVLKSQQSALTSLGQSATPSQSTTGSAFNFRLNAYA